MKPWTVEVAVGMERRMPSIWGIFKNWWDCDSRRWAVSVREVSRITSRIWVWCKEINRGITQWPQGTHGRTVWGGVQWERWWVFFWTCPIWDACEISRWTFYFILFFKMHFIYLFIYFGCVGSSLLCRLSLVVASGGYSSLRCAGFSLLWLLLLRSTGSRHVGFSSCGTRAQ